MINLYAEAMRGDTVPPGKTEACTCALISMSGFLGWTPEKDCPDHQLRSAIGCPCTEEGLEVCVFCGLPAGEGECEDEPCEFRTATDDEKVELRPVRDCREHGWCGGCSSPKCEDCAP